MSGHLIFIAHALSVFFMTGVIWMVQILVYPGFAQVEESEFIQFHEEHSRKITWIVGPMMILQLATAWQLYFTNFRFSLIYLILSVLVFAATAFLSVPQHNILKNGFAEDAWQRLVHTNWVRTNLWTLHSMLVFYHLQII